MFKLQKHDTDWIIFTRLLVDPKDIVLRVEVDISPNQAETNGAINYILIGDVGQTKEAELYKYVKHLILSYFLI